MWNDWINWIIGLVVIALFVVTYLSGRCVPSPTISDERRMMAEVERRLHQAIGKSVPLRAERTWANSDYTVGGKFVALDTPELRDTLIFIEDYPSATRINIVDEINGERITDISKEKLSEVSRRRGKLEKS